VDGEKAKGGRAKKKQIVAVLLQVEQARKWTTSAVRWD